MSRNSRGLRFPPAIQVFPGLKEYVHVRPRRLAAIPIANTLQVKNGDIPACLRHVYHDLGVLVYAGLNNDQISRVGDVVEKLVKSGGVGALITAVDWRSKVTKRRVAPPEKDEYFDAVDWAHAGILKPGTILRIANDYLAKEIEDLVLLRVPSADLSTLQLRERAVSITGNPNPKGIIHSTVDGKRVLPLECYTSIVIDPKFRNVYGEVGLYSGGGKSQYAGSIRIDYTLMYMDEERRHMKTLWLPRNEKEEMEYRHGEGEADGTLRSMTANTLREYIFQPLWKLEREVYGDKADRLVNYDTMKTGLRGWSSRPWEDRTERPRTNRWENSRGGNRGENDGNSSRVRPEW